MNGIVAKMISESHLAADGPQKAVSIADSNECKFGDEQSTRKFSWDFEILRDYTPKVIQG